MDDYKFLKPYITEAGNLKNSDVPNSPMEWIEYEAGNDTVVLDGVFTVEQLEEVVRFMAAKKQTVQIDKLDGLFAYDNGMTDSGIKDDELKAYLRQHLDELEVLLTELARFYLTVNQGHTIEDVANLIEWAKREFGLEYN